MKVVATCLGLVSSQVVFLGKNNVTDVALSAKTECSRVGSSYDDNAIHTANERAQHTWQTAHWGDEQYYDHLKEIIGTVASSNFKQAISRLKTEMSRDSPKVADGFNGLFKVLVDAIKLFPGTSELGNLEAFAEDSVTAIKTMFGKTKEELCPACQASGDYWSILQQIDDKNYDIAEAYNLEADEARVQFVIAVDRCKGSASCEDKVKTGHYDLITAMFRKSRSLDYLTIQVFSKLMNAMNPPITINHWKGFEESSKCAVRPADGFALCGRGAFKNDLTTLKNLVNEYAGGCIAYPEVPFYCGSYEAYWAGNHLDGGCHYRLTQEPNRASCTNQHWYYISSNDDMVASADLFGSKIGC